MILLPNTFKSMLRLRALRAAVCALAFVLMVAPAVNAQMDYGHSISRQPEIRSWVADNDSGDGWRSKAEVMREAKRRYDARVLKITLNEKREIYRVRLLMPNGKVRVVSVSARR